MALKKLKHCILVKQSLQPLVAICVLFAVLGHADADARKFQASGDISTNIITDPKIAASIDFSNGTPGPDDTICVQRKKYVDKTEKDQLKECFVQNVTQCYYTYITEYTDSTIEKCKDFYWKTCKIVFEDKVFNATSRQCKRPLVKKCDQELSSYPKSSSDPKIVCETFFETECNTTKIIPSPGDEPLDVTFCDKIPRKICAPDNCRVVEDFERCDEFNEQSLIEQPVELCDLQPQKHCTQEKVSVPRLIPERKCRNIEKEICNTQMINPHDIKQPIFIKYCTRQEKAPKASYLPPPPASRYSSSPQIQPTYNSNSQPARQSTFTPVPPSSSRIAKQQFRNNPTIFAGPPPPLITIRSKREQDNFEKFDSSITTSALQPSPSPAIRRQGRASWEDEKDGVNKVRPNVFNRRSDNAKEIRRSARSLYNWNSLLDTHPWIPILKTHRKKRHYKRN